jgi:predicted Rossmann fold nucleotide-binding protein DprA/Smf involved in DNA uptake
MEYINMLDAAIATGKSEPTIRRFFQKTSKEQPDLIKMKGKKKLILKDHIFEFYPPTRSHTDKNEVKQSKSEVNEELYKKRIDDLKEQIKELFKIIDQKAKHESELMESIYRNDILLKDVHTKLIASPEEKKPWWKF